jgi:hypothetical protein
MTIKPSDVRRLSKSVEYLHAHKCLTDAAKRVAVKRITKLSVRARRKRATLGERIVRRLAVPCTPTELAAIMGASVHSVRAYLYQLRDAGRVERLNRRLPPAHPIGPGEYLWQRKYLQELV